MVFFIACFFHSGEPMMVCLCVFFSRSIIASETLRCFLFFCYFFSMSFFLRNQTTILENLAGLFYNVREATFSISFDIRVLRSSSLKQTWLLTSFQLEWLS